MEKQVQTLVSGTAVIVSAIVIGASLTASAGIKAYGDLEVKQAENTASADFVGTASREIESDHAKWSITLSHTASSTSEASAALEKDREILRKAIVDAGIADAEYSYQSVNVQEGYSYDYDEYYDRPGRSYPASASQIIVIETDSAAALGEFAQRAPGELSKDGMRVFPRGLEFSFTKLEDLQRDLQQEAAKDAEAQARGLLGSRLGKLRSLGRPVVSVRASGSANNGYYDNYLDTVSLKKKVMVTVNASYRLK